MIRFSSLVIVAAAAILSGCAVQSANDRDAMTFFVDFDHGDDNSHGATRVAPFKHAPGDPQAVGKAGLVTLIAGDTVIFKGGVHYRGSLVIASAGAEGEPITLDGNTEGDFGTGPAIFDGGEVLSDWSKCESADPCGGNPNYANIYRAEAPGRARALTSNLHQDGELRILAQHPNPATPMFTDDTREYLRVAPAKTPRVEIIDSRLAQLGGEQLVGGYVYVWRRTNQIDTRLIDSFNDTTGAITFAQLGGPVYPEVRYALANSLSGAVFDRPGEYVFITPTTGRDPTVYLWPEGPFDPATARVTVAVRPLAIELTGENHFVTIRGFRFQNYQRAIFRGDRLPRARKITIRDNEFTRLKAADYANAVELYNTDEMLIANNDLHDCSKMRGLIAHDGFGAVIRNNRLTRMGRTPIVMYGMSRGKILQNIVRHCRGMHSNGISVYKNNRDILVEGNFVYDSNIPLTCSGTENITIRNNIFDGAGAAQPISFWERVKGEVVIENNILIGSGRGAGLCITGLGDRTGESFDMYLTLRDNIMDGPAMHIMKGEPWLTRTGRVGNIYLSAPSGFSLATDERIVGDIREILPGVAKQDYRRAEGVTAGPKTEE